MSAEAPPTEEAARSPEAVRVAVPRPAAESGPLRRRDITRTADYRQTSNASAVLQAVLDHGPVARSTIARLAGLSPAAVTRLAGDLVAAGLLRESAQPAALKGAGRPHVPVDIDVTRRVALGLHIALNHATLALLDLRGRVLAEELITHPGSGSRAGSRAGAGIDPHHVLERIAARVPGFLGAHADGRRPVGLGVATGGWVDRADGVVVEHALLGWQGVPVRQLLAEATGLPVRVDNHARALVRAEQLFGDPRARASVVHLFVGNMIDAAFATGGQIHHGPQSAAGSVAHLPVDGREEPCACGRRGCLQAVVSSPALARRAVAEGITEDAVFAPVLAAARNGDRRAVALFEERAQLLGSAAATLLDVLNPDLLVITEQGTRHVSGCLEILRAEVGERSRLLADPGRTVVPASFGSQSLQVAAGTVILGALYADPLRRRPRVPAAS
ncbi:MAG TPA: ROK family transcriptional regulator [Trebonia sp.]|jgi:predicted NBD/HSP70 family sugar kinase